MPAVRFNAIGGTLVLVVIIAIGSIKAGAQPRDPTGEQRDLPKGDSLATRDRRGDASARGKTDTGVAAVIARGRRTMLFQGSTPRVTADGRMMFFNSSHLDSRAWAKRMQGGSRYDFDIYYTLRDTNERGEEGWGPPVNLGPSINTSEDDGVEAISPSGNTIYFTSLKKDWVLEGGPFYSAELEATNWKNIRGLGGGITRFFNRSGPFRIYGASLGPNGRAFYFATTAQSRSGDQEIWVSYLREGEWGDPENLGTIVNAGNGSYAPYIAADGRTLYFSSGRDGGYGKDDIYMTVQTDTGWTHPRNLGPHINTSSEDDFFTIPVSGNLVYLSNTHNGKSRIVCAELPDEFRPGEVVALNGMISDATNSLPVNAQVVIEDHRLGREIYRSDAAGKNSRFMALLRTGVEYDMMISAPGYDLYTTRYRIISNGDEKIAHLTVMLNQLEHGMDLSLRTVFFDYDSYTLRKDSFKELARVVEFLQMNPGVELGVTGHTDNIGSEEYNHLLAQNRTDAVIEYLLSKGIARDRISAQSFGSDRPVSSNSTEQGRRQNRCVCFTIMSMNP